MPNDDELEKYIEKLLKLLELGLIDENMFYFLLISIIGIYAYLIIRHLIRNSLYVHLTTYIHINLPDNVGIRRRTILVIDTLDPSMRIVR
jgi:hypothetical protein